MRDAICLVMGLTLFAACARTPDEQRIRDTIAQMQNAVEEGAPRGFMAHVSTDFTGNDGTVDHDGLANALRIEVLRNERQSVLLGPIDLELHGDRATANMTATLSGRSTSSVMPERESIFSITSSWRREGSEWRCYDANWERKL